MRILLELLLFKHTLCLAAVQDVARLRDVALAQLKDSQRAVDIANATIERQQDEFTRIQEQLHAAQTRIDLFEETMAEALAGADQRRIAEVCTGWFFAHVTTVCAKR